VGTHASILVRGLGGSLNRARVRDMEVGRWRIPFFVALI